MIIVHLAQKGRLGPLWKFFAQINKEINRVGVKNELITIEGAGLPQPAHMDEFASWKSRKMVLSEYTKANKMNSNRLFITVVLSMLVLQQAKTQSRFH